FHDLLNTHTQQDVELDKLFMDVAVYNTRIMGAAHVENVMELAIRTALARRGPRHHAGRPAGRAGEEGPALQAQRAASRLGGRRLGAAAAAGAAAGPRRRDPECSQEAVHPGRTGGAGG